MTMQLHQAVSRPSTNLAGRVACLVATRGPVIIIALCLFGWATPVSGAIVFFDTFDETTVGPLLQDHTPDVGTRWVLNEETSGGTTPPFHVYNTSDKAAVPSVDSKNATNPRPDGSSWTYPSSVRASFYAVPAVALTSPNYSVQYDLREAANSSSADFVWIMLRRTATGTFYGAGWYADGVANDCYIFKVIGGVYTQLSNADCGFVDLSIVRFEANNDTLTLYKDSVPVLSAMGGNAITAIGAGGFGAGNIRRATDGYTSAMSIDNFFIDGNTSGVPMPITDAIPPAVSFNNPAPGSTVSGTDVLITASASDNVGVVGVQFKVDGSNIGIEDIQSPAYFVRWNTTQVSNGNHVLTAVARDAAGNTTTSASLTVTVSNGPTLPSFIAQPQDRSVQIGQNAIFSVSAGGSSPLSYQWQSKPPAGSSYSNVSGATSNSYTFPNAQLSDTGTQFRCVVTNSLGSVTSNAATLSVTVAPPLPPGGLPPPSGELATPTLSLPAYLPINSQITAGYTGSTPAAYFSWTFTPLGSTGVSAYRRAGDTSSTPTPRPADTPTLGVSAAPAASFTTPSPVAQLSTAGLDLGPYLVTVTAHSSSGSASASASAQVTLVSPNLDAVRVYPNPWRSDRHAVRSIAFDGLTVNTEIKIFTISGHLVKVLPTSSTRVDWDLTNSSGDRVASGIYLYVMKAEGGGKKTGKLVVVK